MDREKVIITFEKIINVCKEDGCDFVDMSFEDAEQFLVLLKEQEELLRKLQNDKDKLCLEVSKWKHKFHDAPPNFVSQGVVDQIRWERDTALSQLEQIGKCLGSKMNDIVALLKEQEPRVLDWDEIKNYSVVYGEFKGIKDIYPLIITLDNKGRPLSWNPCINTSEEFLFLVYDEEDRKNTRCWNKEPTEEQRQAVKWE